MSVGLGWFAFANYDLLLSPILPAQTSLLAYGVGSGVRLLLSESESRYIRNAFSHYLSPAMVEQLVENPDALVLGGENRELTILFCDIRSFTTISETMEPTELTVFLNNFLTPMTNVLMENGATIDKYIGDAIMAFWNAPLDIPEHRQRACESVLDDARRAGKAERDAGKAGSHRRRPEQRHLLRRQSRFAASASTIRRSATASMSARASRG